jgi:uncharacterized protein (DUF58 family)
MKVRRSFASLALLGTFLAVLAVLTLIPELVLAAFIPIFMLVSSIATPFGLKVTSYSISGGKYVGEEFEVEVRVRAYGIGLLRLEHRLPDFFELVDGSNTVTSFIPIFREVRVRYSAIATRRGVYRLEKLRWGFEDPLMVTFREGVEKLDIQLEVKHRVRSVKRVRLARGVARKPFPEMDIAKLGVPGTDFREIRNYNPGDPVKFINWKATARKGEVMVNQFEVEGKKAVWIFVDANPYMIYGESDRNFLEAAVEAANALAYYFTSRGYRLGMYVIGAKRLIYPDSGTRQFSKIARELLLTDVGDEFQSFERAFEECKPFLIAEKPLVILVTRVEKLKPRRGIARLRRIWRRGLPVMVISLKFEWGEGYGARILDGVRRAFVSSLSGMADVVEWEISKPVDWVLRSVAR